MEIKELIKTPYFMYSNRVCNVSPTDINLTPRTFTCKDSLRTVTEYTVVYRFRMDNKDIFRNRSEVFRTKEELLKSL